MRVPEATAKLEAEAKQVRAASAVLINADAFERWGPKDDVAQREAIEEEAAAASRQRAAAIAAIERQVAALREHHPAAVEAWADAHIELLTSYLGRVDADSTEAFVAAEERDKWAEVRAGDLVRVHQNTYYVRYDRDEYRALFGFDY